MVDDATPSSANISRRICPYSYPNAPKHYTALEQSMVSLFLKLAKSKHTKPAGVFLALTNIWSALWLLVLPYTSIWESQAKAYQIITDLFPLWCLALILCSFGVLHLVVIYNGDLHMRINFALMQFVLSLFAMRLFTVMKFWTLAFGVYPVFFALSFWLFIQLCLNRENDGIA